MLIPLLTTNFPLRYKLRHPIVFVNEKMQKIMHESTEVLLGHIFLYCNYLNTDLLEYIIDELENDNQ